MTNNSIPYHTFLRPKLKASRFGVSKDRPDDIQLIKKTLQGTYHENTKPPINTIAYTYHYNSHHNPINNPTTPFSQRT